MINLAALRLGLGNAVANIANLNHFGYTPDTISPPCFFPADITFDRTATGGRAFGTLRGYDVICRVLTSRADDLAGQKLLDDYLSEGSNNNIVAALESDQTLGGISKTVLVERVDGYRIYTVGADLFYGATFHVSILG